MFFTVGKLTWFFKASFKYCVKFSGYRVEKMNTLSVKFKYSIANSLLNMIHPVTWLIGIISAPTTELKTHLRGRFGSCLHLCVNIHCCVSSPWSTMAYNNVHAQSATVIHLMQPCSAIWTNCSLPTPQIGVVTVTVMEWGSKMGWPVFELHVLLSVLAACLFHINQAQRAATSWRSKCRIYFSGG